MKNAIAQQAYSMQDDTADILVPLGETEITALSTPEPEEAANDNQPLLDVMQGVVWRLAKTAEAQKDDGDEIALGANRDDLNELDFDAPVYGRRGFLDEG